MSIIPVYFMPGLAASSTIFEKIELPNDTFEIILLEWMQPEPNESLQNYAKRMAEKVIRDEAVLIGVSFGGILVQEMAQFLTLRKLIIISSVKSNTELPLRMKMAKTTKAYKLLPTSLLKDVEKFIKYSFGDKFKKRLQLYEKYLHMRNKIYLDWAIKQMICWNRIDIDTNVIHIHGDADDVFPSKNIQKFIVVKGGTHMMILNQYKWFNANLPSIILGKEL